MMDNYIKNIIEANNDNRLAIFVGSAISKSSDTGTHKMPLWKDLIESLKKDLQSTEEDYLKLAQLYFLEHGEYIYYNKVKKFFDIQLEPSEIHKLIFEIKPAYVITTNWDKLLDKAIEDNAYIYDVVSSDIELVKSATQKKLIKMHGDFEHHNFVFKEDDYLNYPTNFPLIENYIKSILSTHTVVFLGYSYSDYNLKQIMKWIQSFSTVKPPAYLVGFSNRKSEIKYLENHGIYSLTLNTNGSSDKDRFEAISGFLTRVKKRNMMKDSNLTHEDVINYFYENLYPFDQMNVLMPEQIRKIFKKVHFKYTEHYVILDLGYDKSNIFYKKFINILTLLNGSSFKKKKLIPFRSKLVTIFHILSKAGIGGIMLDDNQYYPLKCNPYDGVDLSNIINFHLNIDENQKPFQKAFVYYLFGKNKDAFGQYEELIKNSLKSKNYIELFLSMFNWNTLLETLKFDISGDYKKYRQIDKYDIEEKYQDVPNTTKQALSPILSIFIDNNFIYGFISTVSSLLKEKEEQKRSIENGGMVFSNNAFEAEQRLKNLLYFTLGNGFTIDRYSEFREIIESFIKIQVARQVQTDYIRLSELDIFASIKYLNEKSLQAIFDPYTKKEENGNKRLVLNIQEQNYLMRILANTVKYIRSDDAKPFPIFEEYWKKTMYILSIVKLEKDVIDKIMEGFLYVLNTSKNSISTYQTINSFFGYQYHLYNEKISNKSLINIIETVLNKIIYKNYNGHELHAITSNYIANVYGYLSVDKEFNYKNLELVKKLLLELEGWELSNKIEIAKSFLISLHAISDNDIQKEIKQFIMKISKENLNDNQRVDFIFFLLGNKFITIDDIDLSDLVRKIDGIVQKYRDGKSMSDGLQRLRNQLEFFVDNYDLKELQELADETKTLVENFKSHGLFSFF